MPQTSRSDNPDGQNAHNGSNVSAINGANMPKADEENGGGHCSDGSENDYDRLKDYPETIDYYSLLALARDPPPTEAQIRSAYKTLTLSFHPDKQPEALREAATAHYNKIRDAYETLLDPKKRVVYDMLGEEGVRHTWAEGGLMGRNGYAESQQIGVKAMDEAEFRRWFLEAMKRRERAILNDLVDASGVIHLSVDATSMFETTPDGDVSIRVPNLRPSAFLLGYALPIPLPDLSWFYSSKSAANGEGNEDRDEPPTGDGLSANQMPTKLQLQASVNGRFGKTVQTVKLLNPETGEKFDGQMQIPLTIRNANVNFGATFTHVISSDPSRRSILKGPLLSFLGDAVVTINTPLLPQPLAQASISKLITPIEGTRPFSLTVKSTCSSSPLLCPPDLGLTISRMVGAAGVVTCDWSSGSLSWPEFLMGIFMDASKRDQYGEFLRIYSMSGISIGYTSLPTILLPADPHDDDHETDEGDRDMLFPDHDHNHPKQPQQLPEPNETWGFNLGSSPAGVNLTMQYGRTIFARKPAEPLRSEWSSEGYYPSKSRSGSGAIRLGLRVVIESDLSMGWSLSGSRRVGEFTRMGLTVSTIGGMGLGCSVSWSRLGQTFKIPIALCPVDKITGDLCTLAVIMPAAVYGAVEFGYLRPRARRREKQEIAKMQKRLTKLVAKRKAESVQAVSMMRDQVLRRQDREADRDGLVVVHAEYGCPPTATLKNKKQQNGTTAVDECYEEGMIDVTIPVAALVDQGQLVLSRRVNKVSNSPSNLSAFVFPPFNQADITNTKY
ncbi:DnaJ domain-containing protein [Histoplasma capsulatum G186AR]|uniref:DnaJ domain-containing protein n=1 Tax=Ajellomyces capsulatus (strain G186AR / H82 / ATCC MYA-2454 / RMSCC 2432) TaxID=447093 RepID=C0NTG8_AJECG|nr:DnaJ domain-containing protein [Histoplasma capsulatum G186AR]EEH05329.1 DnaJ domain-containing protein [Histoplasma capsulatum G186AR]